MEDQERQQLRELLRAHQSRLQVLEVQQAKQGIQTPAQVITEITDIRSAIARIETQLGHRVPSVSRAALRQLRQQGLTAFYAKEWDRAEELLEQVVGLDPDDQHAQSKLSKTQRQLDLRAFYQAIVDLRDAGNWQAVLEALDDLSRRAPGYPDLQGLRAWAETWRRRDQQYAAASAACERQDWSAALGALEQLQGEFPDDIEIRTLQDRAHAALQHQAAPDRWDIEL
jgi:tetratricopeptide (TPR) repeat protein